MRIRRTAFVALFGLLASTAAAGQDVVFRSDVGVMVFAIRTDRAAAFEHVIDTLVSALRSGGASDAPPAIPLRVLKGAEGVDGVIQYLLVADPPVAGVNYSLPQLISVAVRERPADLIAQLVFATEGRPPTILDLRALQNLTRVDALRNRLDTMLAAQLDPSNAVAAGSPRVDPETRRSVEQLRGRLWSIDAVDCRIVERSGAEWRVEWSYTLRNLSLVDAIAADVTVEFVDLDGVVVHAIAGGHPTPGPQATHVESGVAQIAAASAARIVAARVRVELRQ